ncbi:spore germination protein [Paenibacillus puldeungensis]|uniref:Spore germination protein n=1 Tax=Paenibacillus puldeungensis TaxID=696536 RepID=A0ABW3S0B7_9BACL
MARSPKDNLAELKKTLEHLPDAVFKPLHLGESGGEVVVVYLSGIADLAVINEQIIKTLILIGLNVGSTKLSAEKVEQELAQRTSLTFGRNEQGDLASCVKEILSGNTCLLIKGSEDILIASTGSFPSRNVEEPSTETLVRGPREGFIEDLHSNLSMVRRYIKDLSFKMDLYHIGRRSSRKLAVLYISDIANEELVQEVKQRIEAIDIDDATDTGIIEQWLEENMWSPFPQLQATERLDKAVNGLTSGRVVIILDGSPFVLIAPMTFWMLAQSPEDYYERFLLGTFFRILRLFALLIATFLPSLYVALVSFHPGLIPPELVMSIVAARQDVPFPVFVEALIMEVALEILREASLRLPKGIGQVIGIVGGLVIGQAAVQASIVSAILIIIVGLTAISSFASPQYSGSLGIRLLRFPIMIAAAIYGLYGVILAFIFLGAHMVKLKSFGVSYMSPMAPIRLRDQQDTLVRLPLKKIRKRPVMLNTKDDTLSNKKRK